MMELWSLFGFSFLLVTAVVGVLLAGAGALIAGRVIGEARRTDTPQDPFAVSLPPVIRRRRVVPQLPLPGILIGEEPVEATPSVHERLLV